MNCPKCGKSFPSGPKTCPFCGYTIQYLRKCPSCGWKLEQLQRMCPNCGLDLAPFKTGDLTSRPPSGWRRLFKEDLERPRVRGESALVIVGIAAAIMGILLPAGIFAIIDIGIGGWLYMRGAKKKGIIFLLVGIILLLVSIFISMLITQTP